jgi:hypothetical protein
MMPVRLQDGRVNAVASRDGGDFLQGNGPARQIDIPTLHPARAVLLNAGLGILPKRRAATWSRPYSLSTS